ncbi:uncharacterized protein LOC111086231 [Limulus polyphemus]|uniref:Uncharacterized protein LOC111086231 n=1 Tax=Limulus polyphemus TaxID=6850 RepID=A0ABM1SK02_LIMPO|nr:uncharacterized protein LOC111086231 [Limulus polyphemus]
MSSIIYSMYPLVAERECQTLQAAGITTPLHLSYEIFKGITNVRSAYQPDSLKTGETTVDFDDVRNRIAYLYMYAMAHTEIVENFFNSFYSNSIFFNDWLRNCNETLKICSIGGGPGSEIAGLILGLKDTLFRTTVHATIIDRCEGWKNLFEYLLSLLETYKLVQKIERLRLICENMFQHHWNEEVIEEISKANIITMMKFISAIVWNEKLCRRALRQIFKTMKPGSLLLFIENAGGRSYQVMDQEASKYGLLQVIEPILHYQYKSSNLYLTSFFLLLKKHMNMNPLKTTKLSIAVWQKKPLNYSLQDMQIDIRHYQLANLQLSFLGNIMTFEDTEEEISKRKTRKCSSMIPNYEYEYGRNFQPSRPQTASLAPAQSTSIPTAHYSHSVNTISSLPRRPQTANLAPTQSTNIRTTHHSRLLSYCTII